MALKKPQFEQEPNDTGDTAVMDSAAGADVSTATQDTSTAGASAPAQEATAKVSASTAIATAANSAVATQDAAHRAKEFQKEFDGMKDASEFSYGDYRQFKGNNGSIVESGGDQEDLGRWIKGRLISWGEHWEVSPGEQSASSKNFVAYSKGGKVIDSVIGEEMRSWVGKSVADYAAHLVNEEEFAGARSRRFIDLGVALLATDNGDGPIGKVIQLTLSESSIPSFARYNQELADTARCVQMGLPGFKLPEDPFTIFFIRELASKGANKWTKVRLSSDLPAKI